jgi:oligopeptide transport system permease protein
VWYATQVSIRLALVVAVGESIVGVIFGLIWGYVRSLDRFFTELYNLIDNVPYIIYMTLIALMVGQSFWIMAISMIAINWLSMARRVRNMVFMFRDREYNLASRCLGTPLWRVLTKNILPYLVSVIILRMALSIPATINLGEEEAPSEMRSLGISSYIVKANNTPRQVVTHVKEIESRE